MKKTALALAFALLLLASTRAGTQVLDVADANYFPPPSTEIFSPFPPPVVYSNASIKLSVRINVLPSEHDITFIRYSLDGKGNVTLTNITKEDNVWYWTTTEGVLAQGKAFSTEASLGNLANGNHTLIVYGHYADGKEMSRTREFTVDTSHKPPVWNPPEIVLSSPQNQTYKSTEVPLTFATNETIQYANYVLDPLKGNGSHPIAGNITLTELSNGMHKLILTVYTDRGMAQQTTFFTVERETETQQPFPALMMIAVVAIGALVGLGLMIYLKKRGENQTK